MFIGHANALSAGRISEKCLENASFSSGHAQLHIVNVIIRAKCKCVRVCVCVYELFVSTVFMAD